MGWKTYKTLKMMKNQKEIMFGILAAAIVGLIVLNKKGGGGNNPNNPNDWSGGGNAATITYNDALKIAQGIQNAVGYFSTDWHAISLEFMKLRNDRDIELLYKVFGTWDGPQVVNGDLFTALNMAKTISVIASEEQAFKVIKQYSFSYAKNWNW